MKINWKTLLYATIGGLFFSVISGIYLYFEWQNHRNLELSVMIFPIIILVVFFFSSVYWFYNEIEYRNKKWGEKRPWYSWFWWPSRKIGERIYWNQLIHLTYAIPFLVYLWVVYIGKYSVNIGIISAIFSFILSLFIISRFNRWLEKPKSIEEIQKVTTGKKIRISVIIAVVAELLLFIPVLLIQMTREDASEVDIADLGALVIIFFIVFLFFFTLSYFGVSDYYKQKQKKMENK
ncbi:MAG: hypothetical protein NTV74_04425 [Euryarchaeota archaeon]|nr:hypothetical protein [Euryarchaeota archaeon]